MRNASRFSRQQSDVTDHVIYRAISLPLPGVEILAYIRTVCISVCEIRGINIACTAGFTGISYRPILHEPQACRQHGALSHPVCCEISYCSSLTHYPRTHLQTSDGRFAIKENKLFDSIQHQIRLHSVYTWIAWHDAIVQVSVEFSKFKHTKLTKHQCFLNSRQEEVREQQDGAKWERVWNRNSKCFYAAVIANRKVTRSIRKSDLLEYILPSLIQTDREQERWAEGGTHVGVELLYHRVVLDRRR